MELIGPKSLLSFICFSSSPDCDISEKKFKSLLWKISNTYKNKEKNKMNHHHGPIKQFQQLSTRDQLFNLAPHFLLNILK